MVSNLFLRLSSSKEDSKIIHSDNISTYFIAGDFHGQYDGLWSNGFHLFQSLSIDKYQTIEMKRTSPYYFSLIYRKRYSLKGYIFKQNKGCFIELFERRLFKRKSRSYKLCFAISSSFQIIDRLDDTIYLKYDSPQREGFGYNDYFMAIALGENFQIKEATTDARGLILEVVAKNVKEEPQLYLLYNSSIVALKENLKINRGSLEDVKKFHIRSTLLPFKYTEFDLDEKNYKKALLWSVLSSYSLVMLKGERLGIWAGYPWFDNNWGRDTFIALPGVSLVTGRFEEAGHILENFAKYQCLDEQSAEYGKFPNVVYSADSIYYNTADATPLFIRELYEYYLYTGDVGEVLCFWDNIKLALDVCYLGKRDERGFILSLDGDDWMDARYKGEGSYSPRGGYPVEIQALWYTALVAAARIGESILQAMESGQPLEPGHSAEELRDSSRIYDEAAVKLKESIVKLFVSDSQPYIIDHINEDNTEDRQVRPNVLPAIYYSDMPGIEPLFEKNIVMKHLSFIMPQLIFPHGVASLSRQDSAFHPFHISDKYHKDAAYHNGIIWGWLAGMFIHVACRCGLNNLAFRMSKNLAREIVKGDVPGTLSELHDPALDSGGEVKSRGAYSQAWSISEFTRAFYQDYMGIRPDVPARTLYLTPNLPSEIQSARFKVRYGLHETLIITLKVKKKKGSDNQASLLSFLEVKGVKLQSPLTVVISINCGDSERGREIRTVVTLNRTKDQFITSLDNLQDGRVKIKDLYMNYASELKSFEINEEEGRGKFVEDSFSYSENSISSMLDCFCTLREDNSLESKLGFIEDKS